MNEPNPIQRAPGNHLGPEPGDPDVSDENVTRVKVEKLKASSGTIEALNAYVVEGDFHGRPAGSPKEHALCQVGSRLVHPTRNARTGLIPK
ncbi:MAG: hypothetical protein QUV35_07460 [Hydrogenophaga sp.]|uniref:hypothetical protein n=1 Tax=Hydrogenophaga sp. TaxID=1904254 RepID=UPI0026297566|nr:hypothetical protein [Hydrogenophaga sp.]MDM7942450.1 hypothetical protein [Hydrogenophaga sp.]